MHLLMKLHSDNQDFYKPQTPEFVAIDLDQNRHHIEVCALEALDMKSRYKLTPASVSFPMGEGISWIPQEAFRDFDFYDDAASNGVVLLEILPEVETSACMAPAQLDLDPSNPSVIVVNAAGINARTEPFEISQLSKLDPYSGLGMDLYGGFGPGR